jgi:ribosomal RNA-processing protein 7
MLEDPNRALWEHATSSYHHFLDDPYSGQGKFAHVIFASPKAKKQALKTMQKMNKDTNIIAFGALELQQLSDESKRMHAKEMSKKDDDDESNADSDQENSDEDVQSDSLTGIMALADRFRSCSQVDRSDLMNACNEIMSEFEESEEAERKARMATAEPDEDGFVTVSYTGVSAGSKRELESSGGDAEASSGNNGRRRANKRSRTKKKGEGASELKDFYRFQMKENRKRGIQDLRKRFEEDLAKVKKLKEEKQYRPF